MKTASPPLPGFPLPLPPRTTRLEIEGRIHTLRGERIMLDSDLAILYKVSTKALNQQVRRNPNRFPEDFMFQLTEEEAQNLRSQNVTSSGDISDKARNIKGKQSNLRSQNVTSSSEAYGGRRYLPHAFTEQGVAMLSSVLTSERAIRVNIAIMRTFVRLRALIQTQHTLAGKLERMEEKYDAQLQVVFEVLDALVHTVVPDKKKPFGFSGD